MPPQAYALVTLFAACSLLLGIVAHRLVATRAAGPTGWRWAVLPVIAAFGSFYLIGHRLGLSIGPEIGLFGFQVALLGDLALGFVGALVVALAQAFVVRARAGNRSAAA
jgi:predicted membrane-bound dolichyl-phosphate-mannose-protein mannosyltransferase